MASSIVSPEMMNHGVFAEIIVLLGTAVLMVALFRRLHLPAILAYLCVGAIAGPYGMGWMADTENTRALAEFGVVFLLFTIGLEFSLPQMIAMKNVVLGLGGAQVLITTLFGALVARSFGMTAAGAFVVGGVLALSSTAIVTRQLIEQVELNSRHGRYALGVLLFQDLAVIPFLIVIAALGGGIEPAIVVPLSLAMLKGITAFFVMLAIGHWLLRPLFIEIAAARSSELFMLSVLLFTLGAAWLTQMSGLSLALGAFLAGMMLGETEFRHQVEADIRPFRDVLLGLFFITIGMLLDVRALPKVGHWIILVGIAIVLFKTVLIYTLSRLMRAEPGVALRTGLVLAQGGEFGFALLSLATVHGLLNAHDNQVVLGGTLLSMALSPLIIRYNGALAKRLFVKSYAGGRDRHAQAVQQDATVLSQHVLICGYGRIGQNIARFLEQEGFEYLALDLDPHTVSEARAAGERVHYGDSTRREILEAAGLTRARVLVISYDDAPATIKILQHTRLLRPDMPVLVRTRDDTELERFQTLGATEVVPETLEASLMLVSHLLLLLDVPVARVIRRVRDVRADRYRLLRGFFHGDDSDALDATPGFRERLHAVTLPDGAFAVGRTIAELNLAQSGIQVTAVRRGGIRGPQPGPGTGLRAGDVLVLYGSPEALERAEALLLKG
ncbi:MAG: cation:proton antiporter domain-containing protein [Gammaproteobacteria bacterium]